MEEIPFELTSFFYICIQCFIRDALEVLNSQGVDPMRVSLAIRTIGKLAAPIAKFSGKGSLKEAFHRLQPFGASLRYKPLNKLKHDTLKHPNCKPERIESDDFLPCLRELRKSNGKNGGHLYPLSWEGSLQ
jgi:hypothetical protein